MLENHNSASANVALGDAMKNWNFIRGREGRGCFCRAEALQREDNNVLVKHGCELSRRRRRGHIAFGIGKKSKKKKKKTSAAASRLPSHPHEHVGVPNLDDRDKGTWEFRG